MPLPLAVIGPEGERNRPASSGRVRPNREAAASAVSSMPDGMPMMPMEAIWEYWTFWMPKAVLALASLSEIFTSPNKLPVCTVSRPMTLLSACAPEIRDMASRLPFWRNSRPMALSDTLPLLKRAMDSR